MDNILGLHHDLKHHIYHHGSYQAFRINDPKPRQIHKASVRDRLLHHAVYRVLYPFFDRRFIADSFSCQVGKGTHRALDRFRTFFRKVGRNNTRTCWILKCDIKKFFEYIDHDTLMAILARSIADKDTLWLLGDIIQSFNAAPSRGLPLGNLTSQLLVNVYMNEFDYFMKYHVRIKHYIRYADDFTVLSHDRGELEELLPKIAAFLRERLKLELHPRKVTINTIASGVDFLGWTHFPDHRVLRVVTKRRMLKNLKRGSAATTQSYLGLMKHGNTYKLKKRVLVI